MTSYTNSPRGVVKSVGNQDYSYVPSYIRPRDPHSPTSASTDVKPKEQQGYYPISSLWTNSVNGNVWVLASITNNLAKWVLITNGAGLAIMFNVPVGASPVVPDIAGNVTFTSSDSSVTITGSPNTIDFKAIVPPTALEQFQIDAHTAPGTNPVVPSANLITLEGGATYATGTRNNPIRTNSLAANTIDLEIQLSGSAAGAAATNKFGVAQFDSNQFDVSSGFVQLKGNGVNPALTKVGTQTGTNPVVPDATGKITFNGAVAPQGTNPVRTDGTGANTVAIEVQTAQTSVATDATKIGLAAFKSTDFSVDANGFVSLLGGNVGTSSFTVDAFTAPGTQPVVPTAGGNLTVTGRQVAAGTTTNVIRTDSLAANTFTIEVQRSQAVASSTVGDNGVCHFDSNSFSVDSNGFVTSTGFASAYTNVNHAASPYTVLSTDYYISVDCSAGAVTLNFPNAPTAKRRWIIKDRTGNAGTNNITLTTPGGIVTFDGATSYVLKTNFSAVEMLANSTPTYEIF